MSPSKLSNQRHHAKNRARQRYGLELNRHDLRDIAKQIISGDATLIEKQSNRVSMYWVTVEGQRCRVIYDRLRKNIVTFLPPEDVERRAEAA